MGSQAGHAPSLLPTRSEPMATIFIFFFSWSFNHHLSPLSPSDSNCPFVLLATSPLFCSFFLSFFSLFLSLRLSYLLDFSQPLIFPVPSSPLCSRLSLSHIIGLSLFASAYFFWLHCFKSCFLSLAPLSLSVSGCLPPFSHSLAVSLELGCEFYQHQSRANCKTEVPGGPGCDHFILAMSLDV